ncbi:MAG: 2-oxoacid:acceptor oxidoreductase family protein [Desulfitobacteriaceae bacterium]
MKEEIIFAGFGGQGILFVGQVLAYAGLLEGYEISWLPSYGPEMRGGTAACTVVISDTRIRSALVDYPTSVIALNQPSLDKFEPRLRPQGLLIYNDSMSNRVNQRTDIRVAGVPADTLATQINARKSMNMVMLGAYLSVSPIVKQESVQKALEKLVPEERAMLRDINWQALKLGGITS